MEQFDGGKIKERREGFGWTRNMLTLKWFARFGEPLTEQSVARWERGEKPKASNLMRLARLLGVSVRYFYNNAN